MSSNCSNTLSYVVPFCGNGLADATTFKISPKKWHARIATNVAIIVTTTAPVIALTAAPYFLIPFAIGMYNMQIIPILELRFADKKIKKIALEECRNSPQPHEKAVDIVLANDAALMALPLPEKRIILNKPDSKQYSFLEHVPFDTDAKLRLIKNGADPFLKFGNRSSTFEQALLFGDFNLAEKCVSLTKHKFTRAEQFAILKKQLLTNRARFLFKKCRFNPNVTNNEGKSILLSIVENEGSPMVFAELIRQGARKRQVKKYLLNKIEETKPGSLDINASAVERELFTKHLNKHVYYNEMYNLLVQTETLNNRTLSH